MAHSQSPLRERLISPDLATRVSALIEVRSYPVDEKLIEPLLKALDDSNATSLREAAKTWAQLYREVHEVLAESAAEFAFEEREYKAIWNRIYSIQNQLIERWTAAAHSPDVATRTEGIRALCTFGSSPEDLLNPVRFRCGLGLANSPEFRSQTVLKSLSPSVLQPLLDDPDPKVVYRLHSILKPKWSPDWLPKIKGYLASGRRDLQGLGVSMLVDAPSDTQLDLLAPLIEDKEFIRSSAFFILLGTSRDANIAELAQPKLKRHVAVRTFAISRLPVNSHWLKALLHDEEPEVRIAAMCRQMGPQSIADFMPYRHMLDDPSPLVRGAALRRAATAKAPGLLPYLKQALSSSDTRLREDGMVAFRDIPGSADLAGQLIAAAEIGNSRIYSVNPPFDDPRCAPLLDQCLNSPSGAVRYMALSFLSKNAKENLPRLIKLAADSDREVAYAASLALSEVDSEAFIAAAGRLVSSASEKEADGLRLFLEKTGVAAAIPLLKVLAQHNSPKIQRDARKAIRVMEKKLNP